MSNKIIFRILINSLIGAVLIFFWLKLVDVKAVFETLSKVNLWMLPLPIIFFLIASFLRTLRFKLLLSNFKLPISSLWCLNFLSQLLSFTIPIRAGEVTKAVYLSSHFNLPFAKSLVWVFLDRFLDFWFSLVLALLLMLFIPTNLPENFKPVLSIAVISISLATFFILFLPNTAKKILQVLISLFIFSNIKKFLTNITEFLIDSSVFLKKNSRGNLTIIALTISSLIADALSWYLAFVALGREYFDYITIQLGSVLSALTYLIPAAPGYVGSAEASGLLVFSYGLGMDKTLVSAATVLIHALTLVYILFFGLISLYLLKFDLNLVWKKFKK